MKIIICIILSSLIINCALAEDALQEHQWQATLKAVDETGQPVVGAKIQVGYDMSTNIIAGLTDTNGRFIASHTSRSVDLGFYAEKPSYYPFRMQYHMGFFYKPEIWNPVQTVVLKRIIRPVPMYAKQLRTHVPDLDKPIGYDLTVGDWIAPYGRGNQGDILFTAHFDKPNNDESDFTLTIGFPNQKDGIQEFSVPAYYLGSQGSELRSAEEAPADGYQPEWVQTDNRKAGQPVKTNRDLNRNYYFRVRTKMDDRGNIVSAHYGKIYGDFMQFTYYLNPTPNSRNVEFDPKQNLIKNLKPEEEVSEP